MFYACSSRMKIVVAAVSVCVGFIILLLYNNQGTLSHSTSKSAKHSWTLASGAVPMWTLDLGRPVRTSLENTMHFGVYGSAADADWASIIPDNGGVVYMGQEKRPFMPSMFHQLQCLNTIRLSYLQVNSTIGQGVDPTAQHCLNYLRQMCLCRADLNLEQVIDDFFHLVHFRREQTCRNWEIPYAEHARNNAEYAS